MHLSKMLSTERLLRLTNETLPIIAMIPLLFAHGLAQEPGSGKAPKVTYGFETDFNSRYVWRGIAQSEGPVEQTTAWVSVSGFTFCAWGNMELGRGPQR